MRGSYLKNGGNDEQAGNPEQSPLDNPQLASERVRRPNMVPLTFRPKFCKDTLDQVPFEQSHKMPKAVRTSMMG